MNSAAWSWSAALALFVLALGCTRSPVPEESSRKAQRIWKDHESVVAQAVKGEEHDTDEFKRSVNFFREVAGLEIRVEIYTLGYMPTVETLEDLELIRSWFDANSDRLYYDSDTQTVRVLEP